jgi:outer membrane protein assembly factor BamB
VFIMDSKETLQWYGYSLATGDKLWGPVGGATAFNYYSTIGQGSSADVGYIANGDFYVGGYGGIIYCYSDTTGALQWTWGNGPIGSTNSTFSGFNTPYGNWPNFVGLIADGIVYVYNGNHGNGVPFYKGETITALNATTGTEIWTEQSGVEVGGFEDWRIPVADGDIAYFNYYDGQVYCIGQGPSETTIQTPLDGISQGGRLVIQGTVMDTAAGTKQEEQAADFPNGVPCVSDASESAWMQYVYMGLPMPTNITGVPVTISAIDPNGNNVIIGTTTTDSSGLYSLEVNSNTLAAGAGLYKVTATFAGSNSYWPSSAESNLVVQPATQTPAPTAPPVTGLASTANLELGVAAIVIVIVIIGAILAMLMLRKRP